MSLLLGIKDENGIRNELRNGAPATVVIENPFFVTNNTFQNGSAMWIQNKNRAS